MVYWHYQVHVVGLYDFIAVYLMPKPDLILPGLTSTYCTTKSILKQNMSP